MESSGKIFSILFLWPDGPKNAIFFEPRSFAKQIFPAKIWLFYPNRSIFYISAWGGDIHKINTNWILLTGAGIYFAKKVFPFFYGFKEWILGNIFDKTGKIFDTRLHHLMRKILFMWFKSPQKALPRALEMEKISTQMEMWYSVASN